MILRKPQPNQSIDRQRTDIILDINAYNQCLQGVECYSRTELCCCLVFAFWLMRADVRLPSRRCHLFLKTCVRCSGGNGDGLAGRCRRLGSRSRIRSQTHSQINISPIRHIEHFGKRCCCEFVCVCVCARQDEETSFDCAAEHPHAVGRCARVFSANYRISGGGLASISSSSSRHKMWRPCLLCRALFITLL